MTNLPPSSGDPTQALPSHPTSPGGYAAPPGATPPPGGYGPPSGGYGPPTGGYGQPTAPPGGSGGGMSTGAIIAIAAIVVVAVIAAGVGIVLVTGGGDDEAGSTTTTEEESTTTEEESTTTTADPGADPDEISVDGEQTVEGTISGDEPNFHQLAVPDGEVALVTVTPTTDDFDLVLTGGGRSFDDGLAGQPETVEVTGPGTFELSVVGYQAATGSYTVTIEEAP